jgi:exodeoxyribonuclease VII large subunit
MNGQQRSLVTFMDPGSKKDGAPTPPDAEEVPGPGIFTVTELTRLISDHIAEHPGLQNVRVMGELSNFNRSARGHIYFTLKDEGSQVSCVIFARLGREVNFDLQEGDRVIAHGHVSVYEPQGRYQLYVKSVVRHGVGELYQRFLELKDSLEREGLFAPELKRELPRLPRRVGVVTSATGSVFHDIVRILRRRYPHVRVTLAHASVQGEHAAPELVDGLERIANLGDVDVVIIGRGGGSLEDLWPFNEEVVARAIRASPVPVVSAVGHETDYTIADMVADRRAPTPSAAAEMVVPNELDETRMLESYRSRLMNAVARVLTRAQDRLAGLAERPALSRPKEALVMRFQRLDDLARRLETQGRHLMERETSRIQALDERLVALSPMATLHRGYAIAIDADGSLVHSTAQVSPGDLLEVVMSDGRLDTRVDRVRPDASPDGGD